MIAVVSLRETKGSSLRDLDRIDRERLDEASVPADSVSSRS